ncbi:hypothetical protein CEAn_00530 [Coxiella endosymbiont of Amblyomma nuttalli]|nr:hypothetical protein CEAn_00530 [Coxiella endosymbiont of Amblyomma nuttalli]
MHQLIIYSLTHDIELIVLTLLHLKCSKVTATDFEINQIKTYREF